MPNNKIIQILRGDANAIANNPNMVLLDGQPLYNKTDNLIYIGDGETALSSLHSINAKTDGNGEDIVDTYARKDGTYDSLTSGKLNKNAGTSVRPIYFSNGVPVQCSANINVNIRGKANDSSNLNGIAASEYAFINSTGSITSSGGFQAGNNSQAYFGAAVGLNSACPQGGAAIGSDTYAMFGGAVGQEAKTNDGGAIGFRAQSTDGFAGGNNAVATASGAVQLGEGTNKNSNTLQFRGYQILDSNGHIPADRWGDILTDIESRLDDLGFSSDGISDIITLGNGWSVTQNESISNTYTKQGGVLILDASFSVDVSVPPYDDDRSGGTKTWTIGKIKSGFIPKSSVSTKCQVMYYYTTGSSGSYTTVPANLNIDTSGNLTISFSVNTGWIIVSRTDVTAYIYSLGYFVQL